MAAYFQHNSESQAGDGLQTLVLMNPPTYVQYSGEQPLPTQVSSLPGNNLIFLNSVASTSSFPQTSQHLVGIPLPPGSVTGDSNSQSMHHEMSPYHGFASRIHGNLWNPIDPAADATGLESTTPRSQQGLSLSLSSQQQRQPPLPNYGAFRSSERDQVAAASRPQASAVVSAEDIRLSPGGLSPAASGVTIGVSGMPSAVLSSKYLKAAQELLDEVVNVGHGIMHKKDKSKKDGEEKKMSGELTARPKTGDGSASGEGTSRKSGAELTAVERQEVQMKKAKLMTMLDEVEQRYRQYHHHMQVVVASFEQALGVGSARSYTSLALKTISKQFRCLRDAIAGQVKAASQSLGEEESSPQGKLQGTSRLKFVDHHFRQQQALQQLGMVPHNSNAWRPQRGLPERAVSVLRAWLFEHFLHPYPKDSDKQTLAKQTGLTRSQVSNWFINARVRLWKPMVEEMYLEETKENEKNESGDKPGKTGHKNNEDSTSKSCPPQNRTPSLSTSANSTSPMGGNLGTNTGFSLIGSSELEGIAQVGNKKLRSSQLLQAQAIEVDNKPRDLTNNEPEQLPLAMGFNDERQSRHNYPMLRGPANFIGGFEQYPIEDIGRFGAEQFTAPRFPGNGVSLTLGLPHCENLSIPGNHHHQNFLHGQSIQLGRRLEMGDEQHELSGLSSSGPNSSTAFEGMNIQNNRKRFAAQLMPDFVA
ncbi:BEL1-like homeodomain protein 1 [Punica granatum]|uniref:BEL1-like homeodomain protein 1 n=2 Tax=Punica granatum TaxID=22663 RepID=A0A6P8C9H8_PUNGR|nr:BEL1-like homeodomain protein 1 [Punica granatum]XP_031380392.1 BEL1-like homeodomain protein 1 [Punica granatum]XP_031380393.1 BEL1-like homeodomain protein 1 [Punica granatum]OWM79030.1 hypothetical protein CDL15_Pgr003201 [Punica granatum]PKI42972.1 hypothetical protein CRG98_036770 [Punica granatum]